MQCCLRFNLNNEFPDFDCHFSLSRVSLNSNIVSRSSSLEHFFTEFMLLSELCPDNLRPLCESLDSRPWMYVLELYRPFVETCLLKFKINRSILALDLHWGVGSCISPQVLRTLVFTHEILVERFGLIFWSEMFLKSSKISWPVCPFMPTNSVNKSVYPWVGFQSGWREETRREAISECRPL